jgi:glyoxylase-like metal-dependent hydrolase (beta-lactamase superfamily II)
MTETLRTLRQVLSPASILLPGHGPATTMARELASNPFLR